MKRKHTPKNMQNIANFFAKRTPANPPPTDPTTENHEPIISNEQNPHEASQQQSSPSHYSTQNSPQIQDDQIPTQNTTPHVRGERLSETDFFNLPQDPGKRRKMSDFHHDDRDLVRRTYLLKDPCQPKDCVFPQTLIGPKKRRFCVKWYETWTSWLEYSVEKDAAICYICYLFKDENAIGGDVFVNGGFRSWNRLDIIKNHVGKHMSAHSNAVIAMNLFKIVIAMNLFKKQKSNISSALSKQTKETMSAYRLQLEASIESIRYLLQQGLSFWGHDESASSTNRGNFLELLILLSKHDIGYAKVVLKNAPGNCQLIAPSIQKDIINACAKETTKAILEDLNGGFFSILADEFAHVSDKEQMALCLRYVNKKGEVCERFLGVVHVPNTCSLTLKNAIESLLMEDSLTFSQVRGQGYDGASNMQGSINGLRTFIENECKQAYFVHCFAHQLQLTQVALAKKNPDCVWLFVDVLAPLLNFVGGSQKRKEFLREKQAENVVEALSLGELETGTSLNQERGLGRPCDTRWGSHFKTILNVLDLYPSILGSLEAIALVAETLDKNRAQTLISLMLSFDFVFVAQLMIGIFGITNNLNVALQKHDQDIVNAMAMVDITKTNLQNMRNEGWDIHMEKVNDFMVKYDLEVPNIEDKYVFPGRKMFRVKSPQVTNLHHFRVEVFFSVIDLQLQELENRFPEISKDLLMCMSSFNPVNRFASFDKRKLIELAKFYPKEFSSTELLFFDHTLENFIVAVRGDDRFWNVKSLSELSVKFVETGLSETHERVYLLLKLVLILPVAAQVLKEYFQE